MKNECYELIAEWIYHNEKLREINKYLFDHTELFEELYCSDFNNDLFRFFAGKITRYGRDYNELYKKLTSEQRKELNRVKLMRR